MSAVLLVNPKYAHNVGGALRACACFGALELAWTGDRVPPPEDWPAGARLPREERMRLYRLVSLRYLQEFGPSASFYGDRVPVCVERSKSAESLVDFMHPDRVVYVFGPEDGHVPKRFRASCHRFVSIPTANDGPLNLAAAVNVVLYDRAAKLGLNVPERAREGA
jgi:tRNA(Leu) C34 or U34 (ribose-2'-O)-methylase TrmL